MLEYARIFLNGRSRALSDVTDERTDRCVGSFVAVTTLCPVHEEPRTNGVDEEEAVVHHHVLFFSSAIFWTQ
jgi:hypothetical protein